MSHYLRIVACVVGMGLWLLWCGQREQPKPAAVPPPLAPTVSVAVPVQKVPEEAASLEERLDRPVEVSGVRVSVFSLAIDKVPLRDVDEQTTESAHDHFQIALTIENLSPDQAINYQGWGPAMADHAAALVDEQEHAFATSRFEEKTVFGQHRQPQEIKPGQSVLERLVFEVPPQSAKYLRLQLPLEALGLVGNAELVIQNPLTVTKGGFF